VAVSLPTATAPAGELGKRPAATVRPRRRLSRETGAALVFVAPAMLGFVVFYLWPTIRGFYLSLTKYSLLAPPEFVGMDNFQRLAGDALFWNSLKVTGEYVAINIAVQTVVALGLAVLIHRLTRSTAIRGLIMFPYLIANVIVALVWFYLLDYQIGFVNEVLNWVGLPRIAFFGDSAWAIPTIAMINVWRHMGYTALLIFAGLQTIPKDVYEAAAMDGSSEWRTFWKITLPLLRPVLVLVLVLTVIGSFQIFDTIAVTTEGGPINATRVIYYYIYQLAFERFDFGYAAALAVVLLVILSGVAIAQLKLLRANESDLS
jgi:multiple sugar transport system permease protein